jgi:protein involved in polysaccharide export with SLBB domain
MRAIRRLLPVTAVLPLLAALSASAAAQAGGADPVPVLNPGDAVRIIVWRSTELSGDFDIASDSTIAHPLYREVKAGGVPFTVVQERLRQMLQRYSTTPQFVAQPLFRVSVGGQVRVPGLQTLQPEVTISQAIARAGGITERGRLDRVHLTRNGTETVLNLTVEGPGEQRVRSGDQIFVDQRSSVFRDYIAPAGGIVAAAAALVNIIIRH